MDICNEKFKHKATKISKQNHIVEEISEKGDSQYHCTICRKTFRSRSQKYYHLNCNQLQRAIYNCEHCDKGFLRHSQWKYHLESHISPINKCNKCQKTFSNPLTLKKHVALHKIEPKLCPHCSKTFQKKISLEHHIAAQHLNQFQYGCSFCSKKYASKSSLQLHLQTHEKKRFKCSFCEKLFQRNSILNLHIKRHNNTCSFTCTICQKFFSESGALARHRKIHEENVMQYHCKLCNKSILRKDNMTRHLSTIHPKEKFDNIVEIRPMKNVPELADIESQQKIAVNCFVGEYINTSKNNLLIIDNKLIEKPPEGISKINCNNQPSINQIKVITPVPEDFKELFATDTNKTSHRKMIHQTQEIYSSALEDDKSNNSQFANDPSLVLPNCGACPQVLNKSAIKMEYKTANIPPGSFQSHLKNSQSQTEQQTNIKESYNNQKMHHTEKSLNNLNTLQFECKTFNSLESVDLQAIDKFEINSNFEIKEKTQTQQQTVIRSVGNVRKNLGSNNITLPKPDNIINSEYKHKKYCHSNYNIDLYRKILGCDDEEVGNQQQNFIKLQTDGDCDAINNHILKSAAPVHWRKCFKNNYETSAS